MIQASGLECMRCGTQFALSHYADDCPACRPIVRSNLSVSYGVRLNGRRSRPKPGPARSMWRFGDMLPVAAADAVSMGEGGTPLTALPRLASELGIRALYAKDESRNPTWSFKDRLASSAISTARALGARVIASSSSGNAGAAVAAYAARSGMRCVVFTLHSSAGAMVTQMRAYGAMVIGTKTKADRWTLLERGVRDFGWFPTSPFFGPVVGSNPFGIEGYKTLAYEIAEQLDWRVPDWCVLPVCYGDALVGMWKGFLEMQEWGWTDRVPRMIAAEVYGSIQTAIAEDLPAPPDMPKTHETIALSIGATQSAFQALDVVRRSRGHAITVGNDDMLRWQHTLGEREGLYGEPAAVAPAVAVEQLRANGVIGADDSVVLLFTSSGLKDQSAMVAAMDDLPVAEGNLESVADVLEKRYGFCPNGGAP